MFFSPKRDGSSNQSKLWLNKCCPHHDIQVWNNCKSQTPNKHYWHYCSSNFSSSWIALSDPVSSFCCEADASLWMSGAMGSASWMEGHGSEKKYSGMPNHNWEQSFKSSAQIPPALRFRIITSSTSSGPGRSLKHPSICCWTQKTIANQPVGKSLAAGKFHLGWTIGRPHSCPRKNLGQPLGLRKLRKYRG